MPVDGDSDQLLRTAIAMDELKRISKWSMSKHMLFLVDACYGGLAAMNTRSIPNNTPGYIDKIVKDYSRQIITAGGADEKVMEKDEWQNSAFTKNIISGLKDKKADTDELYNEALEIIKSERKASTSFLQRKLQIGYNRAARIIDQMEANGEVSKANHVGKREVLK